MKKWMNQPHYHKHGWVKYDEVQREMNELKRDFADTLTVIRNSIKLPTHLLELIDRKFDEYRDK